MTALLDRLTSCRRPKLLISAARIGSLDYTRKQALYRLLGAAESLGHEAALGALMDLEKEHDDLRRAHDATYSVARHVEVLASVMGEARLFGASQSPAPPASAPSHTSATLPADHVANSTKPPLTLDAI